MKNIFLIIFIILKFQKFLFSLKNIKINLIFQDKFKYIRIKRMKINVKVS